MGDDWKELHLEGDTIVHLGEHKLRIAELQRQVSVKPVEPIDYTQGYTEEMAQADMERLLRVMEERRDTGLDVGERGLRWASMLLSRLNVFRLGAVPSSPGYHHARRVYEEGG